MLRNEQFQIGRTKSLSVAAAALIVILLAASPSSADEPEDADSGGAAASDPTAAVNFQDLKLRYFNLTEDNEESTVEAEGSYVFSSSFKLSHKLIGTRTNRSGDWETGLRELSLKPIYLHPIKPFGIDAKFALGVEWLKDLGKTRDGTGTGTDQIGPFTGIGWSLTDDDFVITLVQYFHSYDEDDGFEEVRRTAPRLIYIRKLPSIKGWGKVDLKTSIEHEDDNDFRQTLELQLGTMVSDRIGIYGDAFVGDSVLDTDAYDMGFGIGLRVLY
jgi:hypothetical protein